MGRELTINTEIITEFEDDSVCYAVAALQRDMRNALSDTDRPGVRIRLEHGRIPEECFEIKLSGDELQIRASSPLGIIYGVYKISREFLGVQNFWFWMDQKFIPQESIEIPENYIFVSKPFRVRFRGWFVNDEVLISDWSVDRDKKKPWEMVFEALMRCGGNLVIPGTDKNSVRYRKTASDMGLFITHHHAEPLGAEMFARVYPGLKASYAENGKLFRELWKKGIEEQKDLKVVWNLGFRGQGDCPFWAEDTKYDTDETRGELISSLIRLQYQMVKEQNPKAVCCTNLYGETMELYQKGFLRLPEDVILIWADNGYGKMVSRRQDNHNPRVPSLPKKNAYGHHGIYYHVSFYDLQAAAHITMLPNSFEFVRNELAEALRRGADDYWIINCSNVKPHVLYLDYIADIWKNGDADPDRWVSGFICSYFGKKYTEEIAECFRNFARSSIRYGENEDDHAGEQFFNHVPRILITQFMKDPESSAEEFLWAANFNSFDKQIEWYLQLCREGCNRYEKLLSQCKETVLKLPKESQRLFEDTIMLQTELMYHCCCGAMYICRSLICGLNKDWLTAFYFAGKARDEYLTANASMRKREHGKWHNFYRNECLTDIKQSAWMSESLMGYFRILGDGPHCWRWQRKFMDSEEDKRVSLILNMKNHLTHDKLFELIKEKWEE
ncbi:MAG TPA: glycosyl hydrolase 115 family protein [Candidatus Mediterraneibacter excrementigallinarum]|nr:glycosyl hydrolase 115 family protein [Candidatus Mediterraneibacter excrementigallinarum]